MKRPWIGSLAYTALFLAACSNRSADAATYKTTILHSTGLDYPIAYGVSAGSQVGVGQVLTSGSSSVQRALLWHGPATGYIDLTPPGFTSSSARDIWHGKQVGAAGGHAMLWNGTAESFVDLNPVGASSSAALGISGGYQVGWSVPATDLNQRATRWEGTTASAVDLHPSGYLLSTAWGTSVEGIVGTGRIPEAPGDDRALYWPANGPVVDLHPAGFRWSYAQAISGGRQIGYGHQEDPTIVHALLWNGTAESVVDLHPAGFEQSYAFDISGQSQVGYGTGSTGSSYPRALLWQGTSASVMDLHTFLDVQPIKFLYSMATAIDADGSIVGVASDGVTEYAMLWTPVPEPSSVVGLLWGMALLACTQRYAGR